MREKFESVTIMVQGEVESLRKQRDSAVEEVKRLQGETHEVCAKSAPNSQAGQTNFPPPHVF